MKKDFLEYLENNLDDWAESHLHDWKDHYYRKSVDMVENDLRVNYDFSADLESLENELGRKLTDDEKEYFIEQFTKTIVDNFYHD